jgi:hypothetical protein
MRTLVTHRRSYHEWRNSTPLLDVARVLVGAASVMIVGWALILAVFAARDGNGDQVVDYGLFLVATAVANGLVEFAIRWRRHHG